MQFSRLIDLLGLAFVLAIITTIVARPNSVAVIRGFLDGLAGLIRAGMTVG